MSRPCGLRNSSPAEPNGAEPLQHGDLDHLRFHDGIGGVGMGLCRHRGSGQRGGKHQSLEQHSRNLRGYGKQAPPNSSRCAQFGGCGPAPRRGSTLPDASHLGNAWRCSFWRLLVWVVSQHGHATMRCAAAFLEPVEFMITAGLLITP